MGLSGAPNVAPEKPVTIGMPLRQKNFRPTRITGRIPDRESHRAVYLARLQPARLNLPPCWEALLSAAAENIRGKIPGAPGWV